MAGKNNAKLPDINTLIQAGIDPHTGLPIKLGDTPFSLKNDVKRLLKVVDEQDAINRFKWYRLPRGLNGNLIERILYYKGQGMFFFIDTNKTFYFLPYALDGTIDVYGRYTGTTPLPFNGKAAEGEDGKQKPWIVGLKREPMYDVLGDDEDVKKAINTKCVLLSDYSKGISQTVTSRSILQDSLIDTEAELIPFMRTALISHTGVKGMRVTDEDQQSNVKAASEGINRAALTGEKWIPIVGPIEFQDLTEGEVGKSEEFLLAMNSLENIRLSMYGLDNGGIFEKKAHMLQSESDMTGASNKLVSDDSLAQRQEFCTIVNSIWGLDIWCERNEDNDEQQEQQAQDFSEDNDEGGNDNDIQQ